MLEVWSVSNQCRVITDPLSRGGRGWSLGPAPPPGSLDPVKVDGVRVSTLPPVVTRLQGYQWHGAMKPETCVSQEPGFICLMPGVSILISPDCLCLAAFVTFPGSHSQPGRICRYDVLLTSLTIYIWTFIELLLGVKFVILYSSSLFAESVFQEVLLSASCKAFPRGLNSKEKICVFKLLFGNCSRFPSTIVINGARVWNLEAAGTLLRLR